LFLSKVPYSYQLEHPIQMKLILPHRIASQVEHRIAPIAPGCQIVHIDAQGNPDGDLADADIFLRWWTPGPVFSTVLAAAPQLRWIHTPSAGVEHLISAPEFANPKLILTNSVGAHAIPIAEFVLMYMLNHVKQARNLIELAPPEAWRFEDRTQLDELTDKTVLLLGFGAIGQEIAKRARVFGMRVIASRRTNTPTDGVDQIVTGDDWRALLPEADFVVVAVPLTDQTRGMVGAAELALMKPTGYLINIARGPIIDTAALIAALNAGQIAGAALDVTDPEPPPADHPLWAAKNAWITPHISYSSPRTVERQIGIFIDNLARYANGQPLRNVVDRAAGY
jgi:phosphoglycerate dehydrogenase-like enzyme